MSNDVDNNPTVDDFLQHYGVKGMRWGRRKASASSSSGGSSPTRKELRGMNKVARAGLREEAKKKAADNDDAIREARANRKASQQAIRDARKQYKGDKKQIGSVAARQIMLQNIDKPMKDLLKAGELTQGEAVVSDIIGMGLTLAGMRR